MFEASVPYMSEEAVAARLVEAALQLGFSIEAPLVTGSSHVLNPTTDRAAILAHLWTHRSPVVRFYSPVGQRIGHVLLNWGHGREHLISDFSGSELLTVVAFANGITPLW